MKKYNFEKAKELIEKHRDFLESASLGMHEDWFWTAETVFENGKYAKELTDGLEIAGLDGSDWATPTLQLIFSDGEEEMIEVSMGDSESRITPISEEK